MTTNSEQPADHSATDDLSQWLLDRLVADKTLSEDLRSLILGAFEGSDALDAALSAEAAAAVTAGDLPAEQAASRGVFLKSIRVEGFRGIGSELHLALQPMPGLTVICGRNGSGKSSISEALEVAMTGTTHRWSEKVSAQWKDAWRNLHHGEHPRIRVQVTEENHGETTIGVDWQADGAVGQSTNWIQRHGQPKLNGLEQLGWSAPLLSYRPMLSYDELGTMFAAGPSKLYDTLALVLGLEQISEALERLSQRKKQLSEPSKLLEKERLLLRGRLASVDDERSVHAAAHLQRSPDLDALEAIAAGTARDSWSRGTYLREIASIRIVAGDLTSIAAESLTTAVTTLAKLAEGIEPSIRLREGVLQQALLLHEHNGDQVCPVCGEGRLDEEWVERVRAFLATSEGQRAELMEATKSRQDCRDSASRLIEAMPPALLQTSEPELPGLAPAREAWAAWLAAPEDDLALALHLSEAHPQLEARIATLRQQATTELQSRDDVWSPIASQLASWVQLARRVERSKPKIDLLSRAHRWLRDHDIQLKNERLRPIGDKAKQVWAALRQESNVEISGLRLEGSSTRRRVAIDAAVDGSEAGAISVMSQGELHALALALFLPRATLPVSPFRFVVLDDPVQAMDPAKIDGLVKVLSDIAKERQVIVLSHDDRLPEAVRRAAVPARILEVSRSSNSVVAINNVRDPATRYMSDADALIKDGRLPDATLRRTLPGILRLAAESVARDRFFANAYSAGTSAQTVEETWESARTTRRRVALALFGSADYDLTQWASGDTRRRRALSICGAASHNGLRNDPRDAYMDVARLVGDIKSGRT